MAGESKPVTLFYSYSHRDEDLRNALDDHLAVLRWNGLVAEWHDRQIGAGEEWADAIDRNLTSADIVLLLVSASFIASKYCWGEEMTKALARHERGEARVIPVILRPCRWQSTPFAKLQAVPKDGKPVTSWTDRDEAFDNVVAAIERVVEELNDQVVAEPPVEVLETAGEHAPPSPAKPERIAVKDSVDVQVFRDIDASWCPEMVVLPAGAFVMGSPENEEGRMYSEGPQHRVTLGYRFAMGRYPVTFAQYDHFCDATKRKKPKDQSWGRGTRPVINVRWQDAQAYCGWLAKQTGKIYRLPSEAEWEYACRAGTTTPFSFGETISTDQANYDGNYTYGSGVKGLYREQTVEVGSYPANVWGVHDMHGNVWEWVEDVWHDNYDGAPSDGSAWTDGQGKESSHIRVVRGGSWYYDPRYLRSAIRYRTQPDNRYYVLGFRVARTLD